MTKTEQTKKNVRCIKQTTIQLNQDIIFQSDSVYYHFVEDVGISKKVLSIEYDSRYTWHFKDKFVADTPSPEIIVTSKDWHQAASNNK